MKKLLGIFIVIGLLVWGVNEGQNLIAGAERRVAEREGKTVAQKPVKPVPETKEQDPVKDIAWVEHMQDKVRERMKDPESVQFRNSRIYRGFNNSPVVCGEVNAKNSFGGYNGFSGFIAAGSSLIIVEQDMAPGEFQKSWKQICRD